jgi:hypothetical protein
MLERHVRTNETTGLGETVGVVSLVPGGRPRSAPDVEEDVHAASSVAATTNKAGVRVIRRHYAPDSNRVPSSSCSVARDRAVSGYRGLGPDDLFVGPGLEVVGGPIVSRPPAPSPLGNGRIDPEQL